MVAEGSDKEKSAMDKIVNNNSYYGHFESVVVAMFYDEEEAVRQKGLEEVLAILDKKEEEEAASEETQPKKRRRTTKKMQKEEVKPKKKIREFVKPKLDWNAPHYYNWIDNIEADQKTMPPVFEGLTREELQEAARLGRASDLKLQKFMGTTQCVEREIKIQTEMSQQVKSPERREQESANLHWSINQMPGWMNSKKDYVNHHDDPKCEQEKASSRLSTRSTAINGKKKN